MIDVLQTLALIGIAVVLLWAARHRAHLKDAAVVPSAPEPAAPVVPLSVPPAPPRPAPPPVSSADLVTIRFVTEHGKVIGQTQLDRRYRRPSMQWKALAHGRLMNFVAESHEGRTFTYRRVGYDRHVS